MLTIVAGAQTFSINQGNVTWQYPAALTGEMIFTDGTTLTICGHDFTLSDIKAMTVSTANTEAIKVVIPAEQVCNGGKPACNELSGIHLIFQMSGITHIILESVDNNSIGGTGIVADGEVKELIDKQTIITYAAPEGSTLESGKDYYIMTFPCDFYGGYRLSIYATINGKEQVAHYFGVHQVAEAGSFITPNDLVESELEFGDPDAPLVEEERPGLNSQTRNALRIYKQNPTEENKQALLDVMGIRYDKVVARKKAKLRELEREAKHQSLVGEMQAIVDEMVENRDIRLYQQYLRLIDPREDDNANDEWLVLRGATGNNPYIGYAPVTNAEYKQFKKDFTYAAGQDRYPVCNVTYIDAVAYCDWLNSNDMKHIYRLPSEDDWILGAGHMPKDVKMNSDHVESGLTSVDAYKQTTGACGGIDFWGNCWEWTSTQMATGEYIVKGGAWDTSRDSCRTEYSDDSRDGTNGYANVGFRVVRVDR
jgi:hypothetical protein